MQLDDVERFIRPAQAAGVTAPTLEPLTRVVNRIHTLQATLAEAYNAPTPAGDLITSDRPLDLAALTKDATAHATKRQAIDYIEDTLRDSDSVLSVTVQEWMKDEGPDKTLADLQTVWEPHRLAAQKVKARWGTLTPSDEQIAREATAEELEDYRSFAAGKAKRDKIEAVLEHFVPRATWTTTAFQVTSAVTDDDRELEDGTSLKTTDLFFDNEGRIGDTQQLYRNLNSIRAGREAFELIDQWIYNHGRGTPQPRYAISKFHVDDAEYQSDGRPIYARDLEAFKGILRRLGINEDWRVAKTTIIREQQQKYGRPWVIQIGDLKPYNRWEVQRRLAATLH